MSAEDVAASALLSTIPDEQARTILGHVANRLQSSTRQDSPETVSLARLCIALHRTIEVERPSLLSNAIGLQHELSSYVLSLLCNSEDEPSRVRAAVDLCIVSPRVLDTVLQCCLVAVAYELDRCLDEIKVPQAASIVRTVIDVYDGDGLRVCNRSLTALESMSCLHILLLRSSLRGTFVQDAASLLVLMACAPSTRLSSGAMNALLALLTYCATDGGTIKLLQAQSDLLWTVILELTRQRESSHRTTSAYAIWSCAVCLKEQLLSPETVQKNQYWNLIRDGLSNGSAEQRKYCLSILRHSIASLDVDLELPSMSFSVKDKRSFVDQYTKYEALFETICVSRYLNQVQDSMTELFTIARVGSKVHPTWTIALLHAALAHGMQDSIRKVIGSWTLQHGSKILSKSNDATFGFLVDAFLPWVTLGYHFTSSVSKIGGAVPVCNHGEQLSSFFQNILASQVNGLETIRSVLTFLVRKAGHIFPFSRAYLLDGLETGISLTGMKLDGHCLELVTKVAAVQGFQGMVQDLMIVQCDILRSRSSAEACGSYNLKPLLQARKSINSTTHEFQSISAIQSANSIRPDDATRFVSAPLQSQNASSPGGLTISKFAQTLRDSQCKVLWTTGLSAGVWFLLRALDGAEQFDEGANDLVFAIQALWDEIEVQDYPRNVMKTIPYVFFHLNCVRFCKPGSELTTLLSRLAIELQKLAENRIYVFAPLTEALRTALLQCESTAAILLPFTEYVVRYADSPPNTRVEFELEKAISGRLEKEVPSRTYAYYYGKDAGYAHGCIIDLINRLPATSHWTRESRTILDRILAHWVKQKHPVPVFSHWKTSAQLQISLLCMERVLPYLSSLDIDMYLEKLFHVMALEPLPRFRYLLEWIVVRILLHSSKRRKQLLQDQATADLSNPKYLVSIMKLNTMLVCLPDSDQDSSLELLTQLIPLAASAKIVIRHEAQWSFPKVWDHVKKREWTSLLQNPAFKALDSSIRSLESYRTPPLGRILERFDPIGDHTLTNLFQGNYLRIEPNEPTRLTREDLLSVITSNTELLMSQPGSVIPVGEPPMNTSLLLRKQEDLAPALGQVPLAASVPLQTKSSTWQDALNLLPDTVLGRQRSRVHDVIIVASFIDNPYNIGGLSRVAEVFGVKSLQVGNLKVLASRDFKSVSVSSHLWLPIEELGEDQVSKYLIARQTEGYIAVGIEQTDSSRVLGKGDSLLPRKIVLVLGSEREGIPAKILAQLDFCVEIKQHGVTRSMNVQTAAAVALYEYVRQHPV